MNTAFFVEAIRILMKLMELIYNINAERNAIEAEKKDLEKQIAEFSKSKKESEHDLIDYV